MNKNIDQVTEEIANEMNTTQPTVPTGMILTTSGMVEFLLQAGLAASKVEDRIGADPGFVKNGLKDESEFDVNSASDEVKRLRTLFLREQLKFVYRKRPFTGAMKAAAKIGVSKVEFEFLYDSLIRSGELRYRMSIPNWPNVETKEPLREHVVVG